MVESMLNIRLFSKFLTSEENNIDFFTRWYSGFYRMAWLPKMFAGVNTSTNPGSGRHTGVEGGDGDENNCVISGVEGLAGITDCGTGCGNTNGE